MVKRARAKPSTGWSVVLTGPWVRDYNYAGLLVKPKRPFMWGLTAFEVGDVNQGEHVHIFLVFSETVKYEDLEYSFRPFKNDFPDHVFSARNWTIDDYGIGYHCKGSLLALIGQPPIDIKPFEYYREYYKTVKQATSEGKATREKRQTDMFSVLVREYETRLGDRDWKSYEYKKDLCYEILDEYYSNMQFKSYGKSAFINYLQRLIRLCCGQQAREAFKEDILKRI